MYDVHSLCPSSGGAVVAIEKTPTHYRLRLGGHDSTTSDRHSLHVTVSGTKLHEIVSSLSHHYQTADPVMIDLVCCKLLFLHRDESIEGMNFQLFVSFTQVSAAQSWGYQSPSSTMDLDEIVPSLLEGKGDPQGGFTSFFLCKRDLFFEKLQIAIQEIKQADPSIVELLSGFENAFQEYSGDFEEEEQPEEIDEGDEVESGEDEKEEVEN
eukprot:CAMPEP_0201489414 /NCGR_PEP_ID=MMETSP0151_2-20130828/22754_1 /ASSEMBLY_ACC=CAM_ASM_000257 /TAXON_ID=200890 /ORGANISM="Paramoeba atlantica, Strain 621/1 / CCAP 1560/9" /LENGTH=209 /DNA_ID=CAMNT_0047875013 /DNA_START=66 /DNA_END=695 /DNA_ORIENTATION=+